MDRSLPLRARKAARTRSSIVSAARTLFEEHGFDNTTIDQIADLAEVHKQTIFRHFKSKEQIALAHRAEATDQLEQELADPSRRTDTLTFWRSKLREQCSSLTKRGDYHRYHEFLRSDPRLSVRALAHEMRYQDALSRSLAAEITTLTPGSEIQVDMLAAAILAATRRLVKLAATGEVSPDVLDGMSLEVELFCRRILALI